MKTKLHERKTAKVGRPKKSTKSAENGGAAATKPMTLPDWLQTVVPAEASQRDLQEAAVVQVVEAVKKNALERSRSGVKWEDVTQGAFSDMMEGLHAVEVGGFGETAAQIVVGRRKKETENTGGYRFLNDDELDELGRLFAHASHDKGEHYGLLFVLLEHLQAANYRGRGNDFDTCVWDLRKAFVRYSFHMVDLAADSARDTSYEAITTALAAEGGAE